ncbi:hypothetical protein NPIL_668351 [Nephila pilipes]|uniref:Uncharacterized protein n=1 Tax=Nephila pilipes TaxID=299642 RepID=A0A8X6UEA4_NEPPI|nr:hypothetical protein NPIL_668351 [Nephila pilipes]
MLTFRNTVFGYIATSTVENSNRSKYYDFISRNQTSNDCPQRFWFMEYTKKTPKFQGRKKQFDKKKFVELKEATMRADLIFKCHIKKLTNWEIQKARLTSGLISCRK